MVIAYLIILQRWSAEFWMANGYWTISHVTPSSFQLAKRSAVEEVRTPAFVSQSSSATSLPLPQRPRTFPVRAPVILLKRGFEVTEEVKNES